MQAMLALEDGRVFHGVGYGARAECSGEVVFNTSLSGYQEIFTDPSYAGQIVVLTNPHIGNYGTSPSDAESARPMIEGLVTREFSAMSSNWRSTEVADEYLERNGIPVIAEVDTRAVVRHLRANGVMRGVIASGDNLDETALVAKARAIKKMDGTDLASVVSTKVMYEWSASEPKNQTGDKLLPANDAEATAPMHVVAYDFGIKENILRMLTREGLSGDGRPGEDSGGRRARDEPRRGLLLERSRRPGAAVVRNRECSGAEGEGPAIRHLPWPPDLRPRAGRQDLQAQVRPPRRQPPDSQPSDRQGRNHGAESQLQRRPGVAAGGCRSAPTPTSTTRRWPACATPPTRCSASNTTPKPAPARTIRTTCSRIFAR